MPCKLNNIALSTNLKIITFSVVSLEAVIKQLPDG